MSKNKLFDEESEDDQEITLKTENTYAKKYDQWREKEELYKLEQKYGSKALDSDASVSSDSEDESDEPPEVSEEIETKFLKTLSLLKTKDPRIYDPNYKFFDDVEKEKDKKPKTKTLSFVNSDDDDDSDDGNIFKVEKVALEAQEIESVTGSNREEVKGAKEVKLKEYLTGKVEHIDDDVEEDLAPLKALWSDPKISEGEAFLRDYILNKRYLEDGDAGEAESKIRDDEDLEADEQRVEEQGKFERAYNFRFEEPDSEYLKRFPRTMNYVRPKDDRRSRKRAEVRERKEAEKRRKMEEIGRLKALKLKEIQEKIARIKEVTGNEELAFQEEDIEGDFNPEEHDRRMKAIFDEQYYGEADDEKPVFPDLDEELEIENWENYDQGQNDDLNGQNNDEPHCEDEDFNMDAEYDPKQARNNLLEELKQNMGKKRRNRKRKSKLAELLTTDKPKFIPTIADKTYNDYMEEYYKMDCEDVIGGDLPTRFKYREVVPNDYGLTIEEILLADDKELTQWVPLKKIVKHRPENVEKSEINTYKQKAADTKLKRKVLPSLFKDLSEEPEIIVPVEEATKKKKKKKKVKKEKTIENGDNTVESGNDVLDINQEDNEVLEDHENNNKTDMSELVDPDVNNKKKKKKKQKNLVINTQSESNIDHTEIKDNKISKKKKHKQDKFVVENADNVQPSVQNIDNHNCTAEKLDEKKKKGDNKLDTDNTQKDTLKRKLDVNTIENSPVQSKKKKKNKGVSVNDHQQQDQKKVNKVFNKMKLKQKGKFKSKNKDKTPDDPLGKLSDERLKAYGLNPKKYRSFLKYKKF